jgi:malate synthase
MTDTRLALDVPGVELTASADPTVLTAEAVEFVADLARRFEARRQGLLAARRERQTAIDGGASPRFLPETTDIRNDSWRVAPVPPDLRNRRVEITGPVDRKMIINALNSGANVFMADFEDSNAPTWENNLQGQRNLSDAVRRTIGFTSPEGKAYRLAEKTAVLMVRPRGWHLDEKHMRVDGKPVSGSLFDFGLYFFHNAKELIARKTGPYFYLPKLESYKEAELWNDVFVRAQEALGVPRGTIRATVLIETILAAFEMDEILYALREHSAGLNCGRWDYIFSFIKKFRNRAGFLMPDRSQITMDRAFLKAYVELLIKTCHRRGIHAMGGMAAQIPIKGDEAANDAAIAKVRADKLREVKAGHDGTWVAHPGLVAVARAVFDEHMKTPNQIENLRASVSVSEGDLLALPDGDITEQGLRWNVDVGIQYLAAWLGGNGCVPIYNLMEDAATAEISRSQIWQWVHRGARFGPVRGGRQEPAGGEAVSLDLARRVIGEQRDRLAALPGADAARVREAADLFEQMIADENCPEFLTLEAYKRLN